MSIHYQDESATVHAGDCLDVLRGLAHSSVDAVVTDPPYGLEFMGKGWDGADGFRRSLNAADAGRDNAFGRASRTSPEYRTGGFRDHRCPECSTTPNVFQQWCEAWARECLRVLKPGGHLLAFGGTRTWHRLACAIEDAGFEMRDSIAWLYGSGFPKSLDVSKAIDKAAGATREVVGVAVYGDGHVQNSAESIGYHGSDPESDTRSITAPATDDARTWQGWGTALKPGHEPVVVARKPLIGTVAANVLAHGTGALNVDGCRVGTTVETWPSSRGPNTGGSMSGGVMADRDTGNAPAGRWPANVVLDEAQAAELDRQSGTLTSGKMRPEVDRTTRQGDAYGTFSARTATETYGDTGGASRFFYVAKAPTIERPRDGQTAHPTVKPLDLMRWLVRLVTPPGGLVLDPFAGSGTTAEACVLEHMRCITIEREPDYLPLIVARLSKPLQVGFDFDGGAA